jgi:aminocarboxymuconate-semialdehyde decarboxylase
VKIDAFSHVRPPAYADKVTELVKRSGPGVAAFGGGGLPGPIGQALEDIDVRIRNMDEDGVDKQVITHTVPPIEQTATDPDIASQLATASNNAIIDMTNKYPDRIIPIGTVAMNNIDSAIKEAERCLKQHGMKGILIYTNAAGRLPHDPELQPFFEYMNGQDKPIWVHPYFNPRMPAPDFGVDYGIAQVFHWPLDTVTFMTCLIFGGVLDRYPNLKFITHHAGASIPFFEQRMETHPGPGTGRLPRPMMDYYRSFYVDSAIQGSIGGMLAAHMFYGPDQILYGTDTPYASRDGKGNAAACLKSIEALPCSEADKEKMRSGNLLRLIGEK